VYCLQVAVHAIGDKAVDEVAETFQRALAARLARDAAQKLKRLDPAAPTSRPLRIEHAQHLSSPRACGEHCLLTVGCMQHESTEPFVHNEFHFQISCVEADGVDRYIKRT
jgi:predicted amidohydrolase YtcJ